MTIKDIAKHFNTSVSVVSRALNDSGYVNEEKRKAIKDYASVNHWQPSRTARQLKQSKKNMIGIIIPWILRNQMDFVSQLIYLLHKSSFEWHLVIGNTETAVDQFASMPIEKIIAVNITTEQYPAIKRLAQNKIAVLNVLGFCEDFPSIRYSHEKAMYECVKHLTSAGHRRIAYVGINLTRPVNNLHLYYLKMANQGLKKALDEENIVITPHEHMVFSDLIYQLDNEQLCNMLVNYRPTAAVVWSEQAEAALYSACNKLKIRIPEDISIIGLGGNFMLNGFYPQLTHYRFDYTKLLELIRQFTEAAPGEYTGHRTLDFRFYQGESIKTV